MALSRSSIFLKRHVSAVLFLLTARCCLGNRICLVDKRLSAKFVHYLLRIYA